MKHEERVKLENEMIEKLHNFWESTIKSVQNQGLKGMGIIIDKTKQKEILDMYFTINYNSIDKPLGENPIYEAMYDFESSINKLRNQYKGIDKNTIILEEHMNKFFNEIFAMINKNIREMGVVKQRKLEVPKELQNEIIKTIDTWAYKDKEQLKNKIYDVMDKLTKNESPIEKRGYVEKIRDDMINKHFKEVADLTMKFQDIVSKRENIVKTMYNQYKKKMEKGELKAQQNTKMNEEDLKGKIYQVLNSYQQNEAQIEELKIVRNRVGKYLSKLSLLAHQDGKNTRYKDIKTKQKEYTREFLAEVTLDRDYLSEEQIKDIAGLVNKIKNIVNSAKNGVENDNILKKLKEDVIEEYFQNRINTFELKNTDILEDMRYLTSKYEDNQELDTWFSNQISKNQLGYLIELKSSSKKSVLTIEDKRKILQLVKINNSNISKDNRLNIKKENMALIQVKEIEGKKGEEISKLLDDKIQKLIAKTNKKLGKRELRGNNNEKQKLTRRIKKLFNVNKGKDLLKDMKYELSITNQAVGENRNLMYKISTKINKNNKTYENLTKHRFEGITQNLIKAKKINDTSLEYLNNQQKGIVSERKRAVEQALNQVISKNASKKNGKKKGMEIR